MRHPPGVSDVDPFQSSRVWCVAMSDAFTRLNAVERFGLLPSLCLLGLWSCGGEDSPMATEPRDALVSIPT